MSTRKDIKVRTLGFFLCGVLIAGMTAGCGAASEARSAPASRFDAGACRAQIGAFLDALAEINSRLDVGLTVTELSDHLGDAKVAYDGINIDKLKGKCLTIGAQAEDVYNAYLRSLNAWQNCIDDTYTSDCGSNPAIQNRWATASNKLDKIDSELGR